MKNGEIIYQSRDGLNLFAKSFGPEDADLTVLCLHGLTRNHKDFVPMIQSLGNHRRYIAIDVRGRGRSDRDQDPSKYRLDVYVQDVLDLLAIVKPSKLVLIGTSMGGLMSLLLSQMLSQELLGVVLNDVGPKLEQAGLERIAGYVGNFIEHDSWEDAALAVEKSQHSAFPNFRHDDWMKFAKRTHKENQDGKIVLDYDPAIAESLKNIEADISVEMQTWALFASTFKRPLLVVRGEISDLFSSDTAVKMVHRHGRANVISVSNVGHAPILDEPICVKTIESFLKKLELGQ
ncbi:alpha/beta fold hydrolase [Hirschia baltica]|uniref:Alpha/beta hydrolase fold protein n=1 Tax=Hirschia baltica (strain ATCC 49814 / DSM 5838 / IFAM 1418) TaxID=582402 RepID=C6XJJ1_HIRBI|nr:alpha/beta hydrolase [Hirschia baltica]ACT59286.1 alpha/beta hydrolase fold protein [Hirschia baltica ATCC 49814]